jgi:hypothetical protein
VLVPGVHLARLGDAWDALRPGLEFGLVALEEEMLRRAPCKDVTRARDHYRCVVRHADVHYMDGGKTRDELRCTIT